MLPTASIAVGGSFGCIYIRARAGGSGWLDSPRSSPADPRHPRGAPIRKLGSHRGSGGPASPTRVWRVPGFIFLVSLKSFTQPMR
jgi:hypothetical protein